MDYFTCLFLFGKLNFKRNKSHYYFQNKIPQIKIYKQTNLKKDFKTVSKHSLPNDNRPHIDFFLFLSECNCLHRYELHPFSPVFSLFFRKQLVFDGIFEKNSWKLVQFVATQYLPHQSQSVSYAAPKESFGQGDTEGWHLAFRPSLIRFLHNQQLKDMANFEQSKAHQNKMS